MPGTDLRIHSGHILVLASAGPAAPVPADHGGSYNNDIADDAEQIRYRTEEQEAEQGGPEDLGIIKDGDLSGGSVPVGGCYGHLASGGRDAGAQQHQGLEKGHGTEIRQNKGQHA